MSDSIDRQARQAEGEMRRIAARILVRRDKHQKNTETLLAQRQELAKSQELAEAAHEGELLAEVTDALLLLDERLAMEADARDTADADYQQVLQEAGTLEQELRQAQGASLKYQAARIAEPDPFLPTPQDRALDNVRSAIQNLEAQVELHDSLSPPKPRTTIQDREATARARLAELKAARTEPKAAGERTLGPDTGEAEPASPATESKKKTL